MKKLNWLWSSLGNFTAIAGWIGGSALLAWAVKATNVFVEYQPLSWVLAGFTGAMLGAVAILCVGYGQFLSVTAKARRQMVREAEAIDPMQTIFQDKRIRISDLVNPFEQVVSKKKFINCELIGPANLIPLVGYGKFVGNYFTASDAVEIRLGAQPQNAVLFYDCDFENCRFYKVTLLILSDARQGVNDMIQGLNWLTVLELEGTQVPKVSDAATLSDHIKRWTESVK